MVGAWSTSVARAPLNCANARSSADCASLPSAAEASVDAGAGIGVGAGVTVAGAAYGTSTVPESADHGPCVFAAMPVEGDVMEVTARTRKRSVVPELALSGGANPPGSGAPPVHAMDDVASENCAMALAVALPALAAAAAAITAAAAEAL